MEKLAIFGENLVYRFGGAERSTHLIARQLAELPDFEVTGVSCTWRHLDGVLERYPYPTLDEIPCWGFRRTPYLRYVVNRRRIGGYFAASSASILLANNKAGAIAVNSFRGPTVFFIHDEGNLNARRNYRRDLWSRLKFAGQCVVDFPSYAVFAGMNRAAMRKATLVVANSEYMATRARKVFGIEPVVVYPQIDVRALSAVDMPPVQERPYVMMVGHEEVKGASTFREIARALPEHEFMLVGRTFEDVTREGNLTLRGFADDPVEIYRQAKLVLMPSLWDEGFGMVSVEAAALGIPCIVSSRGGLPETVPLDDCVVRNFRRPSEWVDGIRRVLADYERFSRAAREHAAKFDMRRQIEVLLREIERARAHAAGDDERRE